MSIVLLFQTIAFNLFFVQCRWKVKGDINSFKGPSGKVGERGPEGPNGAEGLPGLDAGESLRVF